MVLLVIMNEHYIIIVYRDFHTGGTFSEILELLAEVPGFWRVRTAGTRNDFSSRNFFWGN